MMICGLEICTNQKRGDTVPKYEQLSKKINDRIIREREAGSFERVAFENGSVIRRHSVSKDRPTLWRPPFVQDIDKIMHCSYYNRYSDKTQVFSLIKNDDITRRSLHVQLVSRIARTIGAALNLNLDLIEAISLGHDIGHPPFAHTGEAYLNELYNKHTGRYFYHNIHSVRVLDGIFPLNISLQTLDGIAGHNGEIPKEEYRPEPILSFEEFDKRIEKCCNDPDYAAHLLPSTLEGAVVRISDVIAYLGKDRQDAARINIIDENDYSSTEIGSINAEIINNLVVNIIENSYGMPYIKLDPKHFEALTVARKENWMKIYESASTRARLDVTAKPMMNEMYGQLLDDLKKGIKTSPIFTHHIDYVNKAHYQRSEKYESTEPNQLVVDYIASMTDDYFIDLHRYMFPTSNLKVEYKGYFDNEK